MYALLLNTRGRVAYDLLIYNVDESRRRLFVEVDHDRRMDFVKILRQYRMRRKVDVDMTDLKVGWSRDEVVTSGAQICTVDPRLVDMGYRVIMDGSAER